MDTKQILQQHSKHWYYNRTVRLATGKNLITKRKDSPPCADMGSPVNNICRAIFLGTALATATPGVEQNRPLLTLKAENKTTEFSKTFLLHFQRAVPDKITSKRKTEKLNIRSVFDLKPILLF